METKRSTTAKKKKRHQSNSLLVESKSYRNFFNFPFNDDDINATVIHCNSHAPVPKIKHLGVLTGHKGPVLGVTCSVDGNYCLSASQDCTIRLWNPLTQLCIKEYSGRHNHGVSCVLPTTDNSRFFSVGGDSTAFLWDVATGCTIRSFVGHNDKITSCALNQKVGEGNLLYTASVDHTVGIWDIRRFSTKPIQQLKEAENTVTCVLADDHLILSGSLDGKIRNYDSRKGKMSTINVYNKISSLSLSKDSEYTLVGCLDNCSLLIDKSSTENATVAEFKNRTQSPDNENWGAAFQSFFDPTEAFILCCSTNLNGINVWDIRRPTNAPKRQTCNHSETDTILNLDFSAQRYDLPPVPVLQENKYEHPNYRTEASYILVTAMTSSKVNVWGWYC